TNTYGAFKRFEAGDQNWSLPGNKNHIEGSWAAGDAPGQIVFTTSAPGSATYYGSYAVDETGSRAKLRIEWSRTGYPPAISSNAAVYVERAPIYLGGDAQALGLLK